MFIPFNRGCRERTFMIDIVGIMDYINKYIFFLIMLILICGYGLHEYFSILENVAKPTYYQNTYIPQNRTQLMSFEEDGRLGNLLMETATLLIVAEKFNITAKILPQMSSKMSHLLTDLPVSQPKISETNHDTASPLATKTGPQHILHLLPMLSPLSLCVPGMQAVECGAGSYVLEQASGVGFSFKI